MALKAVSTILAVLLMGACSSPEKPLIQVIGIEQLVQKINAIQNKPLVVNYWATWCEPCIEEMPELIRFYQEYGEQDVYFLSISADHPDDLQTRILPMIEKLKIPFPVFVVGGESPDMLIKAIDPGWQGSLPATFVYDTNGEIIHRWFSKVNRQELESAVNPLLEF